MHKIFEEGEDASIEELLSNILVTLIILIALENDRKGEWRVINRGRDRFHKGIQIQKHREGWVGAEDTWGRFQNDEDMER